MSKFGDLQEKYQDFLVPAVAIYVDGSRLALDDHILAHIAVDLSIGATCNACYFSLENVYEHSSRKIAPALLDKLKPGAILEVSLGYSSDLNKVFRGYVWETRMDFEEDNLGLAVYGLDARGLMRENQRRMIYREQKISDIIETILKDYTPLISAKTIKADNLEQETNIVQEGDDLEFLLAVADMRGLLLYVDKDKFVMDKLTDKVCIEFDWDQCAVSFGVRYLDESITVAGCNPANAKGFLATKPAKQKAAVNSLLTTKRHIPLGAYLMGDSATKVAESLANTAIREALWGRLTCTGLPEAALGHRIKINNFPFAPLNTGNVFTVVEVSHRFGSEKGFVTTIGITG